MGGGGGEAQPQISLKLADESCVDHLRVLTSCGAFKLSRLDDELRQDLLR